MVTYNWTRQRQEGSSSANPFGFNINCGILPAGSTIRRSIITFDYWIYSDTAEFVDIPVTINYGLSLGSSSTSPGYTPYTDYAATGEVWMWWDQLGTIPIYIFDVSGTINYTAKNDTSSRHIDSKIQRKNSTAGDLYVWFGLEPNSSGTVPWTDTYWTVSSSILYSSP